MLRRRAVLSLSGLVALPLAGCGFHLRQAPTFAFKTIYLNGAPASTLAAELRRNLEAGTGLQVSRDPAQRYTQDVILDVLQDQRERVALSYNSVGQVREFQLRVRVRFALRTPDEREILPSTELLLQQDQSYDETLALAKEQEAQLIFRNLQTDVVRQILRRLAAVRQI
ncbi:LPS assembly lipoprotein LptE [Xylophilus sp. GOD-11R]|uniref:LPS-assembly lipoprotein LptE n=1 Tax=Xylophilus sp. GOD-11R TaxID=3089814 RepID=UPI00298CE45B|nr:LPS assembly lipoprotein LptE [Xylophilus sp. GOD-11R]WPB57219.1 LPS assembly lipoprotein LptE [Xylophilus sp. GOD-11R]